jgi:hypothetical protein
LRGGGVLPPQAATPRPNTRIPNDTNRRRCSVYTRGRRRQSRQSIIHPQRHLLCIKRRLGVRACRQLPSLIDAGRSLIHESYRWHLRCTGAAT